MTWRDETARCSLCEGAAEHEAPDRRGDARSQLPGTAAGRPCGSRRSWWTPTPRRPGRRRRPVAARGRRPGDGRLVLPLRHSLRTGHAAAPDRQPPHARHRLDGGDRGGQLDLRAPGRGHQPDLMGGSAPPGRPATPPSTSTRPTSRVATSAGSRWSMPVHVRALVPAAEAEDPQGPSKWSVHAWSTGAMPQPFQLDGQVTRLDLHVHARRRIGQRAPVRDAARPSVTSGVPTDRVLGSAVYDLGSWPASMRRVTFTFNLAQADVVAAGNRLVLALHLRGESAHDVASLRPPPLSVAARGGDAHAAVSRSATGSRDDVASRSRHRLGDVHGRRPRDRDGARGDHRRPPVPARPQREAGVQAANAGLEAAMYRTNLMQPARCSARCKNPSSGTWVSRRRRRRLVCGADRGPRDGQAYTVRVSAGSSLT